MGEQKRNTEVTTATLVKSSFWYTLSGFLTRAMGFITVPIFTRLLTKEQVGDFTVYSSWQSILLIICGLEVYATINRARFDYKKEEEFNSYITSALVLSTAFTSVVLALYVLFPGLFYKVLLIDEKYMAMMFLYLLTYPAYGMFQAKQRIEYKYKLNAAIAFTIVVSSTLLAVLFVSVFKTDKLFGRIVGQYSLYIITGFVFYIYFFTKSWRIRAESIKYALQIGLPLVFTLLGSNILLSSDNLVVKHLCSGEQVSYISITHSCVNIMLILVQMLNSAWSPWFYDKLHTEDHQQIRKVFKLYVWMIILGTLTVVFLAPEIIMILGGKQYTEAIYILPVNILNGVFTVLTYQFVNLETYYKKPHYAAIITGIVAVFNILLDIVGVKQFGYQAVCYATALCQVLLIGIHYYITLKMGIKQILPITSLILMLVTALLIVPFSFVIYEGNFVRWALIAIVVVGCMIIAMIKRNEIKELVKKLKATPHNSP